MPSVKVAHLRRQGVDLIIAPLDHDFGYRTPEDQREVVGEIQVRARSAGLVGTVVPGIWVRRRRADVVHRATALAPVLPQHGSPVGMGEREPGDFLVADPIRKPAEWLRGPPPDRFHGEYSRRPYAARWWRAPCQL